MDEVPVPWRAALGRPLGGSPARSAPRAYWCLIDPYGRIDGLTLVWKGSGGDTRLWWSNYDNAAGKWEIPQVVDPGANSDSGPRRQRA